MTRTDPLSNPVQTAVFRLMGRALCEAAGLDPDKVTTDVNRVDATHVELYPAVLDDAGNIVVEGDEIKTTIVVVELPDGHPWILEYSPLDDANAAIAAAARLLERERVDVVLGKSTRVWTSTKRLEFVDEVLDALNGVLPAPDPGWTEGTFLDSTTFPMEYQAEGQMPDSVTLVPLRSIPSVILYANPGGYLRMNPADMRRVGELLIDGARAYEASK